MLENLISKLNKKFNLFYYIYIGFAAVTQIAYIIYLFTYYNKYYTTWPNWAYTDVIQSVLKIILMCGLYGLGVYFILKNDEKKFRFLMILEVVTSLFGMFYDAMYLSQNWFYKNMSAYDVFDSIFSIAYWICAGGIGLLYVSNVFFGRNIFKTIMNWLIVAAAFIECLGFILTFVGVCTGDETYWYSIFTGILTSMWCLLLLLAVNKYNLFDLGFVKEAAPVEDNEEPEPAIEENQPDTKEE